MSMRSPSSNSSGKIFLPLLMVVMTLVFLAAVIYQATREPGSSPGGPAVESNASGSIERTPSAPPLPESMPPALSGAPLSAGDVTAPAAPAEVSTARATIQSYFDQMPADVSQLADPLSIAQARDDLRRYLESLPPEAAPILIEMLRSEPDFVNRRFLLYALAKMGTDEAVDGLTEHYWRMEQEDRESEIHHSVAALGQVGTPHSFDVILELVERTAPLQHRARFVRALGQHPDVRQAVPTFTRLIREDLNPKVRLNAAVGLKNSQDLSAAQDIERALETEQNPYVRQAMIGALGGIRDISSLGSLDRILLTDQDHTNRMSAVNAVSKIGGSDARRILERTAQEDANDRVRFDAERMLSQMNGEG